MDGSALLAALLDAQRSGDLAGIRRAVAAWQPVAEAQVRAAADVIAARVPAESARIARRRHAPAPPALEPAAVAVLPGMPPDLVRDLWHRQLATTVVAIAGMAADDLPAYREWFQDWTEGGDAIRPFYRAEALRDYLAEVGKLARLLAGARLQEVAPGAERAADALRGGLDAWEVFGGEQHLDGDGLTVSGSGNALWWKPEVADGGLLSFSYTPLPTPDGGGGALFAFPAAVLGADGFAASQGPMERYNGGIDTYHCTLCRGRSGVSNLRRTGRGLRMLSTVPDACAQRGRTYRIEFGVRAGTVLVAVDGALVHHYADVGCHGAPRLGGRFGVRLFSGAGNRIRLAELSLRAW